MNISEKVIEYVKKSGTVRPNELAGIGVDPSWLHLLAKEGELERIGRGLYRITGAEHSIHIAIADLSKQIPFGVICLLSAMSFHKVGTQLPHETWMALPPGAWVPKRPVWPMRVLRFSGEAYSKGVETHLIDGVPVKVYGVAKTVADCFKFRNNTGLDVALEALREGWRGKHFTIDELTAQSRICRVERIMTPYVEAMVVS
jgi:predicted transcriptional regulator of viral defense system